MTIWQSEGMHTVSAMILSDNQRGSPKAENEDALSVLLSPCVHPSIHPSIQCFLGISATPSFVQDTEDSELSELAPSLGGALDPVGEIGINNQSAMS